MRSKLVLLCASLLLSACAAPPLPDRQAGTKPTPSIQVSPTETAEPAPEFVVLVHTGYSFDDALEICHPFDGDGSPSDPDGMSGRLALEQAHGSIKTKTMSDGRVVLCTLQTHLGSEDCTFSQGHWLHRLVKADGKTLKLPNDLRNYRVHHGEIDAWLWQGDEWYLPPYDFIGTNFNEFCGERQ